ncbi:MAG: hypothetical protein BWY72_01391 [Bacteroidetes bacterium ADurb.Bin416]|nr:MAG: hypothetical protein BWY72_01391 [Bacteroidetes bacterium ADurb.Bin416]
MALGNGHRQRFILQLKPSPSYHNVVLGSHSGFHQDAGLAYSLTVNLVGDALAIDSDAEQVFVGGRQFQHQVSLCLQERFDVIVFYGTLALETIRHIACFQAGIVPISGETRPDHQAFVQQIGVEAKQALHQCSGCHGYGIGKVTVGFAPGGIVKRDLGDVAGA